MSGVPNPVLGSVYLICFGFSWLLETYFDGRKTQETSKVV